MQETMWCFFILLVSESHWGNTALESHWDLEIQERHSVLERGAHWSVLPDF